MIKLKYDDITNINVNKLHDELGDLGEQYYVTSKDSEITLLFPDLSEKKTDVLDEEGNVIDTLVEYQKQIITPVTEIDEEGNEIQNVSVTYESFDLEGLKIKIQTIIDVHDPTPVPPLPTTEDFINDLLVDNLDMSMQINTQDDIINQLLLDSLGGEV